MASQTFNLTGAGAQSSAAIAMAAGEKARVRLTSVTGNPLVFLKVVANGTTTWVPVDSFDGWVSSALLAADTVNVEMRGLKATDNIVGVLESGA